MEDQYIGRQFGCYKIVGASEEKTHDGHKKYIGICTKCGYIRYDRISNFKCESSEHPPHRNPAGTWYTPRLGHIFSEMVQRCFISSNPSYRFYGAKGIHVCEEWITNPRNFNDWALAHGYKSNLTIDRINSAKDYCPDNCRWITAHENSKWKSNTNKIQVNGIIDSGVGWAKRLKIGRNRINNYIRKYGVQKAEQLIQSKLAT